MRASLVCAGLALGAAACTPHGPPPARAALDCPQRQGVLSRTSTSADGRSCAYADSEGDEVSLRLVSVGKDPQAALAPIERELVSGTAAPPSAAESAPASSHDSVAVDLPGLHVAADDGGARVHVAGVNLDAGGQGAVVRSTQAVRLRSEAFARTKRGFLASYVLARDNLPDGVKAVGYEAAGPQTGPLAVAVIKMKTENSGELDKAAKALARRNGDL